MKPEEGVLTILTHLSRMYFPIPIDRTSLFQILGVFGGIFYFYSIFDRFFNQTAETLIRHHILPCLIWVSTLCLRPTEGR